MINKKITITLLLSSFLSWSTCYSEDKITKALLDLANALHTEKKIEEALEYYQKVLERDPTNLDSLLHLGKLYLYSKKEYSTAMQFFEKRLCIEPNCGKTMFELAIALEKNKDLEKATNHYQKVIQLDPHFIKAYEHLVNIYIQKNNKIQAIALCKKVLKIDAHFLNIQKKLINLLTQTKQYHEAIKYCNILIKKQSNNSAYKIKKAHLFILLNKIDEALTLFNEVHKKHPNNPSIIYNIAYLYKKKGEYEKAINLYKKTISLDPKNRNAYLGISNAYLALGHFTLGFKFLDAYNTKKETNFRLRTPEEIKGKKILIQADLLLDDMIQYLRYVKKIKEVGADKVFVQTPGNLVPLFQECLYVDKVLNLHKKEMEGFNKFIPISSLPHLFEITLESITDDCPYLYPPKDLVAVWKEQLKHDNNLKIGIYIPKNTDLPIAELMQIANLENISIYILNNINNADYLKNIKNTNIVHVLGKGLGINETDILQTAAIIQNMDIMITGDSYVAHLAGAMGCSVWVILPYITNWRWMTKRSDSPWYSSMKLFRQTEDGSWQQAINDILASIQKL